ncbi:ficolin-1-like [Saccoglossus kowalevskii]|uniref:Angiopoietin-related protein 1-like n=1 Tax=Saccoglossus kowalevskii TaxID=10224 RepID=A0ABM0LZN1_SACKO|nr:PREDICTED: angiopoietin-related protein 1-like [Saccoglossus kowalevskii]
MNHRLCLQANVFLFTLCMPSVLQSVHSASDRIGTTEAGSAKKLPSIVRPTNSTFWMGMRDCQDLYDAGIREDGVYMVTTRDIERKIVVYCEFDHLKGQGWTVIQRRTDKKVDFNRNWMAYKDGFGDIMSGFWAGNENIFALTNFNGRRYELMIEIDDGQLNMLYAFYDYFRLSHAKYNYRLRLGKYVTGSAIDSMSYHKGHYFSTFDRDNDRSPHNCAERYQGGWWFNACLTSNLNGEYYPEKTSAQSRRGIYWDSVEKEHHYSKFYSVMKIHPVRFSKTKHNDSKTT